MKKVLILLLSLLMLVSCAPAAVTGPSTAPQTGEKPQQSTQAPAVGEIYLIKDEAAACEVVTDVNAEWMTAKAASELKDVLAKKCKSGRVKLSTDVTEVKGMVEILVGETRRELSKELYQKLEWNEIGVLIRDGKIAIGAGMEENLDLACNWFRRNYTVSLKAGNMAVPEVLEFIEITDMAIPEAPDMEGLGEPTVVGCGDDNYLKIYYNTDETDYNNYLATLAEENFTKVMDNQIGKNLCATYTNGTTDVHVYHLDSSAITKVVLAPASNTVPREENAAVPSDKTNDVYMLSTINFGLSMVIQMKDGRFIIIDGAQQSESKDLVNFLVSLAPEGEKPKVAAWIFTHAHPDHTFALLGTKEYGLSERIEVEHFVYNFPSMDIYQHYEPDCIAQTESVIETIENYYPHAKVIKPHTGNQMILGDITVDFLSTQEDVLPNSMNDFNDSSLVMRFTIDGQRLMVTGDMSVSDFVFCNATYADEDLKCDIFQMPHHGHNTDRNFFGAVAPKIALLPNEVEDSCITLMNNSTNSILMELVELFIKVMNNSTNSILMETATKWYGSYETWKITMPFEGDDPAVKVPYGADA